MDINLTKRSNMKRILIISAFLLSSLYGFCQKDLYLQVHFETLRKDWNIAIKDRSFGIVDTNGIIIVDFKYDMIYPLKDNISGWLMVKKDSLFGFIDSHGMEIVPTRYDGIYPFYGQRIDWVIIKKDKFEGIIDSTGMVIIPPKYDMIGRFGEHKDDWDSTVDRVYKTANDTTAYKKVLKFWFNSLRADWAMVEKDKLVGCIDINGKEIIKPIYDSIKIENKVIYGIKAGNRTIFGTNP